MSTERTPITNLEAFTIKGAMRRTGLGELDPVTVILQDHGDGRGTLIVACYNRAWTCYWGAMGGTLREFLSECHSDDVATALIRGRNDQLNQRKSEIEEKYLADISRAVIESIKKEAARG